MLLPKTMVTTDIPTRLNPHLRAFVHEARAPLLNHLLTSTMITATSGGFPPKALVGQFLIVTYNTFWAQMLFASLQVKG
jgi:hypothetical protein